MNGKEVEECVKSFADILITEGINRYGDIHTPMFCYQLDLKSHKPPARDINPMCVSFDASFQSRCSNLYYDTNNIRMLYELSDLTGDNTYASAADDYLRYFMDNCVSKLGLFSWGEHIYYNVFFDKFNFRGHDAQNSKKPVRYRVDDHVNDSRHC